MIELPYAEDLVSFGGLMLISEVEVRASPSPSSSPSHDVVEVSKRKRGWITLCQVRKNGAISLSKQSKQSTLSEPLSPISGLWLDTTSHHLFIFRPLQNPHLGSFIYLNLCLFFCRSRIDKSWNMVKSLYSHQILLPGATKLSIQFPPSN